MAYDPDANPLATEWLALSEERRLDEVVEYHRRTRVELPNARVHAAIHVTVENQLAQQYAPTVHALDRLVREGLSRHEAIHAIGGAVATQMFEVLKRRVPFDAAAFERDLAALTAERWRKS